MIRFHSGMTLIEVMVVVLLLSMLSVGLFSTFSVGQRTYSQLVTGRNDGNELISAQQLLRRLIETAYPLKAEVLQNSYGMEGRAEYIEVTAEAPGNHPIGFYRYRVYTSANSHGTQDLMVRYGLDERGQMKPGVLGLKGEPFSEVLIHDIDSVDISYLQAADNLASNSLVSRAWKREWSRQGRLPEIVKISVRFVPNDRRIWPLLLITPLVTDNAHCEFDTVAQTCRSAS